MTDVVDLMIAADRGLIPIVDPTTHALLGLITRKDLLAVRRTAGGQERDRARFYARRRAPAAPRLSSRAPGFTRP